MPSDKELYTRHETEGLDYSTLAREYGLSPDSVRGRIGRYRRANIVTRLEQRVGKPLALPPGEYVITGDYQINTHSESFVERMLIIARRLRRPRKLIIAGDFINADAFSAYDADIPLASFDDEVVAARAVFVKLLAVFDNIYWLMGNHERRLSRRSRAAIQPRHLLAILSGSPRVTVSNWGYCEIENPNGHTWRVTHGSEYSVNQLTVGDMLALKHQQNIICHHQHHCAIGWDRYKRYVIIDNGGLFEQDEMSYAVLDDNKRPNMQNGFTVLSDGYPTLYSQPPFTNWGKLLKGARRAA